jgi:hypothetical protein
MLDRIALYQTRLRTPGLGLDAKGVALGSRGLVLVSTIDRLVALLAVYTQDRSLEDVLPSLVIHTVRSKLGTREMTLELSAESSDRMDRIADVARLVGGLTFTGTSRHFVQYRDAAAPFGYDATDLLSTDAALALYGDKFTQTYDIEGTVDLRALLVRLMPHVDPSTYDAPGPRYLVAEQGLGAALIHYFVRSRVEGEVCVGEWPPASAFDPSPVRRHIMRVADLPRRMRTLTTTTPGITTFLPAGHGVAVEIGFRHPVSLRACPVFEPGGMVFIRGRGDESWSLPRLPQMGDFRSFARVALRSSDGPVARTTSAPQDVRVPLRVIPTSAPWKNVTAARLGPHEIPLLRRLAYALPHATIAATRIAMTNDGAFLRCAAGIEAIPLGTFYVEIHAGLYIPAGFDVAPAIAPSILYAALGAPTSQAIFVGPDARAVSVDESAFVPLETSLLEAKAWDPLVTEAIEAALEEKPIELRVEPLPLFPLSSADDLPPTPQLPPAPDAT